jgi:hypothetical protein
LTDGPSSTLWIIAGSLLFASAIENCFSIWLPSCNQK